MMRSLVSPLFLKELGNLRPVEQKKIGRPKAPPPPLPDGYHYARRGNMTVYVYFRNSLLGKCDSIEEARESIFLHAKGQLVFDTVRSPNANYLVRKIDPYKWQVWDGGKLMTVQTAKVRAMKWIEENTK